jgi:hypothetical protein
MKLILVKKQLWGAVDPGNLSADRDAQALALIGMHVSDSYLPTIFECKTAKEAWTKLESMLQPASTTRRLALLRELNELRKCNGEPMINYVNRAKQLMTNLLGVGQTVDSKEMALRMLAGLPKQYDVLVTVLEASADLTFDTVVTRLIDMESKLVELDQKSVEAYAARTARKEEFKKRVNANGESVTSSRGDNRTCWACGKRGHIKKDCPTKNVHGLHGQSLAF